MGLVKQFLMSRRDLGYNSRLTPVSKFRCCMKRLADTDKWRRLLLSRGVKPDLADVWAALARPAIRLLPQNQSVTDSTEIGTSKIGGMADLPDGMDWPLRPAYGYAREIREWRDKAVWAPAPLHFIAQINLADVAAAGSDLPLPEQGLLLFFYDVATQPWGFDPLDRAGWRVVYVEAGQRLARTQDPNGSIAVSSLAFEPREGLPDWDHTQYILCEKFGYPIELVRPELDRLSDDDNDAFCTPEGHSFGGWPKLIQRPMEVECQLASHGLYVGSAEGFADPRAPELRTDAHAWRLLLQIESDDSQGRMWGDSGRLYCWCRDEDIAARRFYRTWLVQQCY